MKLQGNILWASQRDGNGIIVGNDKKEYYFDESVCSEFSKLERMTKESVEFELNESIKDCRCAYKVTLIKG